MEKCGISGEFVHQALAQNIAMVNIPESYGCVAVTVKLQYKIFLSKGILFVVVLWIKTTDVISYQWLTKHFNFYCHVFWALLYFLVYAEKYYYSVIFLYINYKSKINPADKIGV